MHILKRLCVLILAAVYLSIFMPLNMYAQTSPTFKSGKWGLEADYLTGKILRHTPKIKHVPSELTQGFQIDYYMKTLGEKPWHKPLNFPEVGATFLFLRFGENKVFGDAIALMGYAKFFIYRSKVVDFYTRVGAGYGIITKKYDYLTNPTNNVISTTINMAVQIRMGMDWKINQYIQLNTAFCFDHFSNAAANLPNYGANLLLGTVGLKIIPKPIDMSYDCHKTTNFKKNEVIWQYTLGIQ